MGGDANLERIADFSANLRISVITRSIHVLQERQLLSQDTQDFPRNHAGGKQLVCHLRNSY
jgi:hypothetical protein